MAKTRAYTGSQGSVLSESPADRQPLNWDAARFNPTDAVPEPVHRRLNTAFEAFLAIKGLSSMLIADGVEVDAAEQGAPLKPGLSYSMPAAVRVISHLASDDLCGLADWLDKQKGAR